MQEEAERAGIVHLGEGKAEGIPYHGPVHKGWLPG